MAMNTNRESLYDLAQTGDQVILEGELVYSRLLERVESSSNFSSDPVWTITIANPRLADTKKYNLNANGADTALGKNILRDSSEVTHGTYKSVKGQHAGETMWTFESKSPRSISILDLKTMQSLPADQLLENELGSGQTVLIGFKVILSKTYNRNIGVLDFVGIQDANNIQYAGGNGINSFSSMFAGGIKGSLQPNPNAGGKSVDNPDEAMNQPTQPQHNPTPQQPQQPASAPKPTGVSEDDLNSLFDE